jgi:hypothetical protein
MPNVMARPVNRVHDDGMMVLQIVRLAADP